MERHNLIVWNVHGLNRRARRNVVRESLSQRHVCMFCLQETKLDVIALAAVLELMGMGFDYFDLPSVGASGGVLIAWRVDRWEASQRFRRRFSVTMCLTA